ncbi:MAG: 3'(2'),5'-bisphosphate nucleotidase CysQ, partial [Myxococcales bacterium]|nr:3'(2'),5'-bisphosphate nucleotidase CysQ [Myxococcales bacterium]
MMDLDAVRRSVVGLTRSSGRVILDIYRRRTAISEKKRDGTPVTQADLASEALLSRGLPEILDVPILSEEARNAPYRDRRGWSTFWLVDPLDGTKEFLRRTGEFAVSIALI